MEVWKVLLLVVVAELAMQFPVGFCFECIVLVFQFVSLYVRLYYSLF